MASAGTKPESLAHAANPPQQNGCYHRQITVPCESGLNQDLSGGKVPKNRKGCDIGYALAANSCEGASSVDACTVTALDAITAFAVPDPNCSSQSTSVFSGPAAPSSCLDEPITQFTSGRLNFHLSQPFQPSTQSTLNACMNNVNAVFWCKCRLQRHDFSNL